MNKRRLIITTIIGLGVIAGIMLVRQVISPQKQAAGPVCANTTVTCTWTQNGDFDKNLSDFNAEVSVIETGEENGAARNTIQKIDVSAEVGSYTFDIDVTSGLNYICSVNLKVKDDLGLHCSGGINESDSDSCSIPDEPPTATPEPTITPTPTGQVECSECTQIQLDVHVEKDRPIANLTPPNEVDEGITYGRVKLVHRPNSQACNANATKCAKIGKDGKVTASGLKIEWLAFDGESCKDDPLVSPVPRNKDNLLLSCEDSKTPEGARFRLHQALAPTEDNPLGCRCYNLSAKFVQVEGEQSTPPEACFVDNPQQVCCPTSCREPEIIDLGNDDFEHGGDIDGCPGDPEGEYDDPGTPKCYFDIVSPQNACLNINQTATMEAHNDYNGGSVNFDDDFRSEDNQNRPKEQTIGNGDTRVSYEYIHGGTYDVRMECTDQAGEVIASCTKRLTTTCKNIPTGEGSPTPSPTPTTDPEITPSPTPDPMCIQEVPIPTVEIVCPEGCSTPIQ